MVRTSQAADSGLCVKVARFALKAAGVSVTVTVRAGPEARRRAGSGAADADLSCNHTSTLSRTRGLGASGSATNLIRHVIVYLVRLISIWYCIANGVFMLPMTLDMPDEGTR
jgi:hypothetical protein